MAKKDNPIKMFTANDIERYHKGLLSSKERHELEKAALDDPFLADALEGYATPGVHADADLKDLRERLSGKTSRDRVIPIAAAKNRYSWLRVAAMIIVIAGAGLLVYQIGFNKKENDIAQVPAGKSTTVQTDSDSAYPVPGSGLALQTVDSSANLQFANPAKDNLANNTPAANAGNAKFDKIAATDSVTVSSGLAATAVPVASAPAFKEEAQAVPDTFYRELSSQTDEAYKKSARKESAAVKDKEAAVITTGFGINDKAAPNAKQKVLSNTQAGEKNYYRNANTFRGRVTDINNNPVPFANVTNIQDNVGTYTDARGNFNLTSPDSMLNVQVRSLGYNSNNIQLHNNVSSNQVIMQEDRSLNEVVISTKKPNSTIRSRDANMKLEGEPEPEDGWDNYDSYLANNLNPPKDFKIKQTGTDSVKLSFEVNKLGEPVNIRVEKSLCERCDQEAIRLIKEGPKWKRKARRGRTTVTISF